MVPSGGTQHGPALQKDKESLAQALSDCVVYCKSVSFRGFQEARSHSRPSEISSLAEAKARKLIRDAGEAEGAAAPGSGPGWRGQEASSGVVLEPPDIGVPSLPSWEKEGPAGLYPRIWLCWVSEWGLLA